MPVAVTMPALSPTMTEGKIAAWKKAVGDTVRSGEVLAEIETDKATMEVEAVDDGTLGRIIVPAGTEGVAVNSVIAMILEDGEDASDLDSMPDATQTPVPPPSAAPSAGKQVAGPSAGPPAAPAAVKQSAGPRILASPLARKLAATRGIELADIRGTGPGGRIVKRDLDGAAAAAAPVAAAPASAPAVVQREAAVPEGAELVPHSTVRKIIAARLTEAWQTIPHIFLSIDCELDRLLEVRQRLNNSAGGDTRLSVNDFLIRAAAFALHKVPQLNVQWSADAAIRLATVDIAVAVAMEGGLVTPIVRNADEKGLAEISSEVRALATRGKAGKLMPEEYKGGSFTISNLGMFGVTQFGAIINPPQAAILAVGAGSPRAVVRDGALATATLMTCTLSCDHRIVDGADGARWLAAFKGFVEEPMTMML